MKLVEREREERGEERRRMGQILVI